MRISRLYTHQPLINEQIITLEEDNAHYLRTVLRLKKDQVIMLFNGNGEEFSGILTEVSRKQVIVYLQQPIVRSVESPLHITLGIGISRGDRMDWAIQKAVELGVNGLTPLITERCVIKFKDEAKKQQKYQHWKNIVQHATEQSTRTFLPDLQPIDNLTSWVTRQQSLKIFLDPYATQSLTNLSSHDQHIALLSGPEGGFADLERQLAIDAGFIPVRLGQRILRTETAALAAIAALQTLWGDFA